MRYSLGAKRNPERKLPHFEASAIPLPPKLITDISMIPVLDQGQQPSCVGHAFASTIMYDYYKKTGKIPSISPRFIYAQAKLTDGDPNGEGTSAYSAFVGVQKQGGCATTQTVPNDVTLGIADYKTVVITDSITKECHEYPIKTEVEIQNPSFSQVQTLIAQYGVVIVAGDVDENTWMGQDGKNTLMPGNAGGHEFLLFGYDTTVPGDWIANRNSWGMQWGYNGNGSFLWSNYQGNIYDVMAITIDMNNPVTYKYFKLTESTGGGHTVAELQPALVQILDKARVIANVPFVITSGFRTAAENIAVGGVPNSAHLTGQAADIACTNSTRQAILTGLLTCGTKVFIEDCQSHIHVDIDSAIHPLGDAIISANG